MSLNTSSEMIVSQTVPESVKDETLQEMKAYLSVMIRQDALTKYTAGHGALFLDPEARNVRHTYIKKTPGNKIWQVQQILDDQDRQNDWAVDFEVDPTLSRERKEPVLKLTGIAEL